MAQQTLEVCGAWAEQRPKLVAIIGADLTLPTIARAMLAGVRNWAAVAAFCKTVVLWKEIMDCAREELLYS